jgi:methylisocitrate lyase
MSDVISQGKKLRKAIEAGKPLKIVGTINAYTALLAEQAGHEAIYLSGGGVAASSLGVPDLGITTLQDVLIDVDRITNASSLPLLVDADTGWGGALVILSTSINTSCKVVIPRSGTPKLEAATPPPDK